MKTISVCMIVKDEELTLERLLKQVKQFADEIIVVDTGSADNTKSIALTFTDKVFDFVWQDDFSLARNYSFSKATSDYIMWLDADDFITEESITALQNLKEHLTNEDTIYLPYQIAFNESGECTFEYLRERIVKNIPIFKWIDPIHEVLIPYGNLATYNIAIQHRKIKQGDSERNLKIYKKMLANGKTLNARQQFYYSNELYYNGYFDDAIENYNKFLKNENAFVENKIQAKINLSKIYQSKNNLTQSKQSLFDTLLFDLPRSEAMCELGHIYLNEKDYKKAIYYYKLAIQKPNIDTFAFVSLDCYNYIPNLQIGLCYYYLLDYEQASKYNKQALKANKKSEIAKNNQKIYNRLISERQAQKSKR
ncbi:MAG: glycosyltransferase [Clostridia bacterium]|nr:glycosyltransferase [Clostridia bacterium]